MAEKKVETVVQGRRERQLKENKGLLSAFRRESIGEIDKELQRWTLNELRAEV